MRGRMTWMTIVLWVGGVIAALVAAGVGAVIVMLMRTERLVEIAVPRLASIPCPACGVEIGLATASAVEAERRAEAQRHWEEAKEKGFVLRRRVDPYWRFPCPACGVALKFDPGEPRDALTKV
jgi:predicted RNA-binding Zn-ribbon protein involved in translation (DUF1610 family)